MKKIFSLFSLIFSLVVQADEGMWPFNAVPTQQLHDLYGIQLDQEWLSHLQNACVRISFGGSGAFVSSEGLLITNQHVGSEAIYTLSTQDRNLLEKGFYASTYEQELKCTDMYVDQLISMIDVTDVINRSVENISQVGEKERVKKETMTRLKKEYQDRTGLQPEEVVLYGGAKYHLYLYKRYTDIRLVFNPESQIAFFGGNYDNFEYPRYSLDVCFFRVYENEKPLRVKHYLRWSPSGPRPSELLFVAGNPGHTQRLNTSSHLRFFKERELPMTLRIVGKKMEALQAYAKTTPEHARIAEQQLTRLSNVSKAYEGIKQGFKEIDIVEKKRQFELSTFEKNGEYAPLVALDQAFEDAKSYYSAYAMLEGVGSNYSTLYTWAKEWVRFSVEREKPNHERLQEYTETELPTLKLNLVSEKPIYPDLEKVNLTCSLDLLKETLGPDHPLIQTVFKRHSSYEIAEKLIDSTCLADLAYRRALLEYPQMIQTSSDPLLEFARLIDPYAREVRKRKEDSLESVQKDSYAQIAEALFKLFGDTIYPDATFTLRLSIGAIKQYEENNKVVEPFTTVGQTFLHAQQHHTLEEFQLPPSWQKEEGSLQKCQTPFNFASTHDIIGGNSGSPVVNVQGEFVGLIFDGNVYSLIWDYQYDDRQGRAVSVHSQAIVEALKTVYGAHRLINEIQK